MHLLEIENLYKFSIKPIPWLKAKTIGVSTGPDVSQGHHPSFRAGVRDRVLSRRNVPGQSKRHKGREINAKAKHEAETDAEKTGIPDLDDIEPTASPGSRQEKVSGVLKCKFG